MNNVSEQYRQVQSIFDEKVLNVRGIEEAKINCARRLFNEISTHRVRYSVCENYQMLLDEIRKIE